MRILYHHRTLGDGAEGIHIAEMVSAFRALGHDVEVIGLASGAPNDGRRGGLIGRARALLPAPAYEIAAAASNVLEYRTVQRAIAKFRPDFVYKRHARNDTAALAAAHDADIPSVLEVNCLYSDSAYRQFEPVTFRRLAERFERKALSLASIAFAVSSPLAQLSANLACSPVKVLPNGANPDMFDPMRTDRRRGRERLGVPDAVTVGWAGILREWHGLDLLLQAIAAIPDVALVVIGDGEQRSDVEARARALGLSNRLVVTGRIPHSNMPEYLAALDIAVVADERTGVASPMKLLEYMAMGLTVVAPDLPNIRDVITPDIDAVLFRRGDARELSGALANVVADGQLRMRLGTNARQKIRQKRSWKRNAETVLTWVGERKSVHGAAAVARMRPTPAGV